MKCQANCEQEAIWIAPKHTIWTSDTKGAYVRDPALCEYHGKIVISSKTCRINCGTVIIKHEISGGERTKCQELGCDREPAYIALKHCVRTDKSEYRYVYYPMLCDVHTNMMVHPLHQLKIGTMVILNENDVEAAE